VPFTEPGGEIGGHGGVQRGQLLEIVGFGIRKG
jgi:hypothetical protein